MAKVSLINMQKLKKELTKNWPVYLVVTPDKVGVYDDVSLALNETKGVGVHICKKNRLNEAETSVKEFHDYFYPNHEFKRTYIPRKNTLVPVGSNRNE